MPPVRCGSVSSRCLRAGAMKVCVLPSPVTVPSRHCVAPHCRREATEHNTGELELLAAGDALEFHGGTKMVGVNLFTGDSPWR
jgi:hypothetical protein